MIISLRGTSGAGKTWLVHELARKFKGVEGEYKGSKWWRMKHRYGKLYCRYEQGTITVAKLWEEVCHFGISGDVIYESAFLRASNGYIEKSSMSLGYSMVFAFLNTPVEACIERVIYRRALTGRKHGEIKPENITRGDREVRSAIDTLRKAGRKVVVVSWENPLESMLGILHSPYLRTKPC